MAKYIPERTHLVWLDFEPIKGREIGKYRPALVLSSKEYNIKTKTIIYCPISTSIRGAKTEVQINNLEYPSVIASSIIQTLSWTDRKCKFLGKINLNIFNDVLLRVIPLIGGSELFSTLIENNLKKKD